MRTNYSVVISALLSMATLAAAQGTGGGASPVQLRGGVSENRYLEPQQARQSAEDARREAEHRRSAEIGRFLENPRVHRVTKVGEVDKNKGTQNYKAVIIQQVKINEDGSVELGELIEGSGNDYELPAGVLRVGDLFTIADNQVVQVPENHFDPLGELAAAGKQQTEISPTAALMNWAKEMDKTATVWENNAMTAADHFFKGMANTLGGTLAHLAQERGDWGRPGKPMQQLLDYLMNDYNENDQKLYEGAVQALDMLQNDPARFWGEHAMDMVPLGELGKEAQMSKLLGSAKRLQQVEENAKGFAALERGAGAGAARNAASAERRGVEQAQRAGELQRPQQAAQRAQQPQQTPQQQRMEAQRARQPEPQVREHGPGQQQAEVQRQAEAQRRAAQDPIAAARERDAQRAQQMASDTPDRARASVGTTGEPGGVGRSGGVGQGGTGSGGAGSGGGGSGGAGTGGAGVPGGVDFENTRPMQPLTPEQHRKQLMDQYGLTEEQARTMEATAAQDMQGNAAARLEGKLQQQADAVQRGFQQEQVRKQADAYRDAVNARAQEGQRPQPSAQQVQPPQREPAPVTQQEIDAARNRIQQQVQRDADQRAQQFFQRQVQNEVNAGRDALRNRARQMPSQQQQQQAAAEFYQQFEESLKQDAAWGGPPAETGRITPRMSARSPIGNSLQQRHGQSPKDPLQGNGGLLEARLGVPVAGTPEGISRAMRAAGSEARGLVFGLMPDGTRRIYNVRNAGGTMEVLDAGSKEAGKLEDLAEMFFYRTN